MKRNYTKKSKKPSKGGRKSKKKVKRNKSKKQVISLRIIRQNRIIGKCRKYRICNGGSNGNRNKEGKMRISIFTSDKDYKDIYVTPDDKIHDSIRTQLNLESNKRIINAVLFGGEPISEEETFDNMDIEDGGRLRCVLRNIIFDDIVKEILKMNKHIADEDLRCSNIWEKQYGNEVNAQTYEVIVDHHKPLQILGDWDLSRLGLIELPDIIGLVQIKGNLNLSNNMLSSLPDGLCKITAKNLLLFKNPLISLPACWPPKSVEFIDGERLPDFLQRGENEEEENIFTRNIYNPNLNLT